MSIQQDDLLELHEILQRRVRRWRAIALAEAIVLGAAVVLGYAILRQAEIVAERAAAEQQAVVVARDAETVSRQLAEEAQQTAELERLYVGKPASVLLDGFGVGIPELGAINDNWGNLVGFSLQRRDRKRIWVWLNAAGKQLDI